MTKGPKLQNNDYTGLLNFAEQLEAASKKLSGHYELEASTMANLRQIVTLLPNYLVNKWGEVSYSIREKGGIPRLSDLSKFVRRQAAIKNDPGCVTEKKPERKNAMNIKGPTLNSRGHTNAFHTGLEAGGLSVNHQHPEKRYLRRCLRCSKDHELAECEQFISDEIQARWDIVKQNKLCHVCLKSGHMRGRCESRIFCSCGSDRRHHRLLHNPPRLRDAITAQDPHLDRQREIQEAQADIQYKDQGTQFPQNPRAIEQYATITEAPSRTILLHVVPVRVIAPSGSSLTTYTLLDNASRGTIISKNIENSLGLKGPPQLVTVNTAVEKTSEHFQLVRFELQSATGTGEIIKVKEGLVSEKFNIPERCLPEDIDNSRYPHLKDIEIPEVQVKAVSVLIGKDVDYAHEVFEVRKPTSHDNRLKALRGPLGWVVTGVVEGHPSEISVNFTNCEKNLRELVEDFWKLEAFGTQEAPRSREGEQVNRLSAPRNWSMEDMRAVKTLQRTTRLSDGRYETGLLWRKEDVRVPNNRCEAERRMCSLKRRFSRDPDLERSYRAAMKECIGKGYARKLSSEEADHLGPWYLPHFPVINQNKPGKVRIVFDAAAEYNGTSLNKNLLQVPNSTNCLIGVLLRFRQENTAIVADQWTNRSVGKLLNSG